MTFSANPRCDEFVGFIHELADAARAVLAKRHDDSRFETKEDASPVTEFDRGVEHALRRAGQARYAEKAACGC